MIRIGLCFILIFHFKAPTQSVRTFNCYSYYFLFCRERNLWNIFSMLKGKGQYKCDRTYMCIICEKWSSVLCRLRDIGDGTSCENVVQSYVGCVILEMVPLALLQQNRLPCSARLPSIYVERKNRCADVQLHNIYKTLFEQKLKYTKSLTRRKVALILEVRDTKRVNSDSIYHLDTAKGTKENVDRYPRLTLTKYSGRSRPFSVPRTSGNVHQKITAEDFLRLGHNRVYSDDSEEDSSDDRKGKINLHTIKEPLVLEFEDVKPELPTEKAEQKQLVNMVRRYRLNSLGNRTIQNVCKIQDRNHRNQSSAVRCTFRVWEL